jgi:membrane-associated phospholipid phosphatase
MAVRHDPVDHRGPSLTLLWTGAGAITAAALLGTAVVVGHAEPPSFDRWWNDVLVAHRAEWTLSAALVLDHIGGGWVAVLVVPLLVVSGLLVLRRWRGAVFAVVAFLVSAGLVQVMKSVFARTRPDDMIVASDFGSFPSGHVANAATLAVVLLLLFPSVWALVSGVVWVVAMALSRTLLSVHWATDTLGGLLVGVGVALLIAAWALPWARTLTVRSALPGGARQGVGGGR